MIIVNFITSIKKIKGGPAKIVIDNMVEFCKNDINTFILTKRSNKDFECDNLFENNIINYNLFTLILKVYYFKKKYPKILFHIHGIWDIDIIIIYFILKLFKIKYIISTRGSLEPWCLKQSRYKKLIALKLYQFNILINSELIHSTSFQEYNNTRKLLEKFEYSFNKFAIIPNGINCNTYNSNIFNYNNVNGEKYILFLSRIDPKKGLDILIKCWNNIRKDIRINWKILIAGDGNKKYINYIQDLISEYNLNNQIIYLGPVYDNNKLELLRNARFMILPSHSENFGNVIAESLSSGVPVITTKNTPWEILNTYNAGFCIDLINLQSTLERLFLISDVEYLQLKNNSRNLILKYFSFEIVVNQYQEMYNFVFCQNNKPDFIFQ